MVREGRLEIRLQCVRAVNYPMAAVPPLFDALPDNACVAYKNLRDGDSQHATEGRQHCEEFWQEFAADADEIFLTEFPLRFHERWSEMYVAVSLRRIGLEVTCPKPGPDIRIDGHDRGIWVEAVCATAGEPGLPDSVPERPIARASDKPVVTNVPHEKVVLRLRNSLEEKARKFEGYRKDGIVAEEDIQVVALNVQAVPYAGRDMEDFMLRALYGVGHHVVTVDRNTGDVVGRDREQILAITKVGTGATVGVQPFIDSSKPHITGILGSRTDACNLPNRPGDDFGFFPNLTANTEWIEGLIPLGEEWRFVEAEGEWAGQRQCHIQTD